MRIILLGGPGAGKGTQANYICEEFSIPRISTGDILRATATEDSSLGQQTKKTLSLGDLVSDKIMCSLIYERIAKNDCANGYLFDGFPRTIAQAKCLQKQNVKIDYVIEIYVDDNEIINRLSGRRVHLASGRSYHEVFNPPKTEGKDDVTGEELIQREDDKENTIRKRLKIYHEQTVPLVTYYSKWMASENNNAPNLVKVNGIGKVSEIKDQIMKALNAESSSCRA